MKLAEELKKSILSDYDYYNSTLTPIDPLEKTIDEIKEKIVSRNIIAKWIYKLFQSSPPITPREMRTKPMEYSLVIAAVSDAYNRIGQKDKGYNYLVKSIEPIDQRFNAFTKDLQAMGKEKAFKEAEKVQKITPFYTYLFDVMNPYDSTYSQEKESQITNAIMKATQ